MGRLESVASFRETRRTIAERSDKPRSARRRALSDATDEWLMSLFHDSVPQQSREAYCLVATGGYGRRELSLRSDIDALLLHDPMAVDVAEVSSSLWYPIWDAGVSLDHSVRTVQESCDLAMRDVTVTMSLMDVRTVAGNERMARELRQMVLSQWRTSALQRLPDLRSTVDARRERFGDLSQLLEPDLKESYGGLRDAAVLRALSASWLVHVPQQPWQQSALDLLDVRDALHSRGRRDTLVMQDQEDIAGEMSDDWGINCADDLLRHVYLCARDIAFASERAWHQCGRLSAQANEHLTVRRPRMGRGAERASGRERSSPSVPLAEGVVLRNGEVTLALNAAPSLDPGLPLRVAAASAQNALPVAPATLDALAATGGRSDMPWDDGTRSSFLSLLGSGFGLIAAVESFDRIGLMERWVRAWPTVRALPQRNPLHEFTVDRHLVATAANASLRAREVHRPDLLVVAALMHDIGKGSKGDHSVVGERIARHEMTTMGFPSNDINTVCTLVRWHLLLPELATRRDVRDPATIDAVIEVISEVGTLKLLHALAWADAEATGAAVRSPWRRRLIAELVFECEERMRGETPPSERQDPPEIVDALNRDGEPWIRIRERDDGYSIVVSAPDEQGLLATAAGVLSLHRLEIREAWLRSTEKRAAQLWVAAPLFGDPPDARAITSDLRAAISGSLNVRDRLYSRFHARQVHLGAAPAVLFDHSPTRHTALEVRSHDEPLLLYRIACALADTNVVVVGGKIDTLGADVVDSFFVTDARGQPLSAEAAHQTRSSVQAALAPVTLS